MITQVHIHTTNALTHSHHTTQCPHTHKHTYDVVPPRTHTHIRRRTFTYTTHIRTHTHVYTTIFKYYAPTSHTTDTCTVCKPARRARQHLTHVHGPRTGNAPGTPRRGTRPQQTCTHAHDNQLIHMELLTQGECTYDNQREPMQQVPTTCTRYYNITSHCRAIAGTSRIHLPQCDPRQRVPTPRYRYRNITSHATPLNRIGRMFLLQPPVQRVICTYNRNKQTYAAGTYCVTQIP